MELIAVDEIDISVDQRSFLGDVDNSFFDGIEYGISLVENEPRVDPVHAAGGVYCRECVFKDTFDCPTSKTGFTFKPMQFCSWGVLRKEEPKEE